MKIKYITPQCVVCGERITTDMCFCYDSRDPWGQSVCDDCKEKIVNRVTGFDAIAGEIINDLMTDKYIVTPYKEREEIA